MTPFTQEIIKVILDKAIIRIILLFTALWINKKFERFKSEQQKILELERQKHDLEIKIIFDKRGKDLEFIEKQINEFFWPVYLRLEKDNVLWKKVPNLFKSEAALPQETNDSFENEFIIKNHDEIVQTLETKTYLIDNDQELLKEILAFIRHIAVYKTIRKIDNLKHLNPYDLNEPYPKNLFPMIKDRLEKSQSRYSNLLASLQEQNATQ